MKQLSLIWILCMCGQMMSSQPPMNRYIAPLFSTVTETTNVQFSTNVPRPNPDDEVDEADGEGAPADAQCARQVVTGAYIWDITDQAGKRAHRVTGEEIATTMPGSARPRRPTGAAATSNAWPPGLR